jgi:hypothetical protein
VKLIDTRIRTNRILTEAEARTTSGTRPSPDAVTAAEMSTPANVMPKARRLALPENSTRKKYSVRPGVASTGRSPKATRKCRLDTRPKLRVPSTSSPSSEMSK